MILFHVIMGTRHCQTAYNANKDANGLYQGGLGSGVTGFGSWGNYNNYYPIIPTSVGVELADGVGVSYYPVVDASGATAYNAPVPVFFGLKNPFGHLWTGKNRIIGVKESDGSYSFYVAKSSLDVWSYSATSDMIKVGSLAAATAAGWEYIKQVSYQGLSGMPSVLGATSTTNYGDGAYRDTASSGFRSPLGSGNANNGDNAGLAYFNGNNAPSNANANLSSPHYLDQECLHLVYLRARPRLTLKHTRSSRFW